MQLSLFEAKTLEAIQKVGTTTDTYTEVANAVGLTQDDLQEKVQRGNQKVGKWQHKIRLIQQRLKQKGFVENIDKNLWRVTPKGKEALLDNEVASKHLPKMYFVTKYGMAFWGDAKSVSELFRNEIDLIVTSPPYLLANDSRGYANLGSNEKAFVEALIGHIESWLPCLTGTASIVINLGDSTLKGEGYQSLYKERLLVALEDRLGLHLVQKFTWYSPSKIPAGYWTTRKRRDCVNATEDFYWLSLNPKKCKANNESVLVEYSQKQRDLIDKAKRKSPIKYKRPSGHDVKEVSFYREGKGAIPSNLLICSPEGANSTYSKFCQENNLPRHPAMFNWKLPDFFIRYLTEKGDVVFDPFSGSGNTAFAAEKNERHWISAELEAQYIEGHIGRMIV